MAWLIFALLAALSWGVGQVLMKKGFEHTNPLFNNFASTIYACLLFVPFALIGGVNWSAYPQILVYAFISALPAFSYYYAAEKGEISLTGTLISIFPVFIIILSTVFLGERITPTQILSIILILAGSFLVSMPKGFAFKLESWVFWGLAAAALIGFSDFVGKVAITKYDLYSYMLAYAIGYAVSMSLLYIFDKKGRSFPKLNQKKLIPTLSGTFLLEVGILLLYLGLNSGKASLVTPVSDIYVAITIVLAVIFLKEKLSKIQIFGVLLAAAGIILMG